MKEHEFKNDPGFRDMTEAETYDVRAGLCIFPVLLGKKIADWLIVRFS